MEEVFIVSAVRTPIGSFMGSLSEVPATQLGSAAIKAALEKINLDPKLVQEVYMGNVLQAGEGQAPAKQAALGAGLSTETPCTTVNKVCASGLKAVMLAAQEIKCGDADILVAGGMENMSSVPHYLNGRKSTKFGEIKMRDGMQHDGLLDAYENRPMGEFAEKCAAEFSFSREEQDRFAEQSYRRAEAAWKDGRFADEVISVSVPQRKGEPVVVSEDEEFKNVKYDKIAQLPSAFIKNGTVTAANASTINDGASALVLMSGKKMRELNLKPLAKIISYADASNAPEWFTTAPVKALELALKKAGMDSSEIDFFEINEAFSVVVLTNAKLLNIDESKINVNGGAVALGHPLGNSGSRILVTLVNVLKQNHARYGAIGICNGGGGAGAMIIENLQM